MDQFIYEKSNNKNLNILQFKHELQKLTEGKKSLIDFDESFYLAVHQDVAQAVANGVFTSGYAHFCLAGREENRIWSNNRLKIDFFITPNYPEGQFAPVNAQIPIVSEDTLAHLPQSKESFLLILFYHLQTNLFFGGYNAFFHDFTSVFSQFDRIVLSVENDEFEPHLATRYVKHIEVISAKKLNRLTVRPDLIVCFTYDLFHKGARLLKDINKVIYYCQDFEACNFALGEHYIEVEKSIVNARNLIISTQILKNFFVKRGLITHNNTYITSPQIEPLNVSPEKENVCFFIFDQNNTLNAICPLLLLVWLKNFVVRIRVMLFIWLVQ